MSTYFKALDTREGNVQILTKSRWLGLVPMPHTTVTPHHAADLKRLGTFIKWTTKDPMTLSNLHDGVIRLVEQVGISGLAEIAESVRMTERVTKGFGGTWQEVIKQASQDGVPFPVPDDMLRYMKGVV